MKSLHPLLLALSASLLTATAFATAPVLTTGTATALPLGMRLTANVDPKGASYDLIIETDLTSTFDAPSPFGDPQPVTGTGSRIVSVESDVPTDHSTLYFRASLIGDTFNPIGAVKNVVANHAPDAFEDAAIVLPGAKATLDVLANDTDPDALNGEIDGIPISMPDLLTLNSVGALTPSTAGTVSIVGNKILFTASATFSGATGSYTVKDNYGAISTGVITLTTGSVSIDPITQSLPAAGGKSEINITTEAAWTATPSASWLSIHQYDELNNLIPSDSGSGAASIVVLVQSNTALTSRTGTVTIGSAVHTITQDGVLAPSFDLDGLPSGSAFDAVISGVFTLPIPIVNGPVTYTATNIPPGLAFASIPDPAGPTMIDVLTGIPNKAGTYAMTVTAKNAAGTAPETLTFSINVKPLPANVIGTYHGFVARSEDTHFSAQPSLGARFEMTTTATGALTGKIIEGSTSKAFTGQIQALLGGDLVPDNFAVRVPVTGTSFSLELDLQGNNLTGTLSGFSAAPVTAWRNPWSKVAPINKAALFKAKHNFAILGDGNGGPAGMGYGTFTVNELTGALTVTGKLADGSTLSVATFISQDGDVLLYQPLYSNRGSFLGRLVVTPGLNPPSNNRINSQATWLKPPALASSKDVLYREGFSIAPTLIGGTYLPPMPGAIVMGLQPSTFDAPFNSTLNFNSGGADFSENILFNNPSATGVTNTAKVPPYIAQNDNLGFPGQNANKVKVSTFSAATGEITGTFTIPGLPAEAGIPAVSSRTANFAGQIVTSVNGTQVQGFYLLSQMPDMSTFPPQTASTAPKFSGRFETPAVGEYGVITVDPPSYIGGAAGVTYEINVHAFGSWAVLDLPNFVTVTPAGGVEDGIVQVTLSANTTTTPRTGVISIGGIFHTVTQGGKPTVVTSPATAIDFEPDSNDVNAARATLNGTVNANGGTCDVVFDYGLTTDYTDTVPSEPTTVVGSTVTNVSTSLYYLKPNSVYHYRVRTVGSSDISGADLTFTTPNRLPTAYEDILDVLPGATVIDVAANDTDPDGDTLVVTAKTAVNPSTAGTLAIVANQLVFTPSGTFSTASFGYTVSDGFGGTASSTVTLTAGQISIDPTDYTELAAGGTYSISVTSTGSWSVSESIPWLSVSQLNGNLNDVVGVTVQPNNSLSIRSGVITIGGVAHSVSQSAAVKPVLSPVEANYIGIVSGYFELAIPTENLPVTYTVTNLPPGLALSNSTGLLSGKPTTAGDYNMTVRASNAAGNSDDTLSFTVSVSPIAPAIVGTFHGLVTRSLDVYVSPNSNIGSRFELTSTSTGSVTGKLIEGSVQKSFAGQLTTTVDSPETASLSTVVADTGFTLDLSFLNNNLTGTLHNTTPPGVPETISTPVNAYRNSWSKTNPASLYAARHNFNIVPGSEGPQGYGYGSFTVTSSTGALTLSGKLADGSAITGSTFVGGDETGGFVLFYLPLYKNSGSCIGSLNVTPGGSAPSDNTLGGALTWMKPASAPDSTETLYGNGFGPVDQSVSGGTYNPPAPGQRVLGASEVFSPDFNAYLSCQFFSQAFRITNPNSTGRSNTVSVPKFIAQNYNVDPPIEGQNPFKVSISKFKADTGDFSGTFTLPASIDPPVPARTPSFSGLIINGSASGFFILPDDPIAPLTIADSPKQSYAITLSAQ